MPGYPRNRLTCSAESLAIIHTVLTGFPANTLIGLSIPVTPVRRRYRSIMQCGAKNPARLSSNRHWFLVAKYPNLTALPSPVPATVPRNRMKTSLPFRIDAGCSTLPVPLIGVRQADVPRRSGSSCSSDRSRRCIHQRRSRTGSLADRYLSLQSDVVLSPRAGRRILFPAVPLSNVSTNHSRIHAFRPMQMNTHTSNS